MCEKMFIVTLLVMSVYFAFGKSTVILEIVGNGLVLVDGSSHVKKYEHKFYEPYNLELTCNLIGAFGQYDLLLENDNINFVGTRVTVPSPPEKIGSISHTFKLTPKSRTISCTARDVETGLSTFKSRVRLTFEKPEGTAPSTPTTDTSPRPDGLPDERPALIIRHDTSSAGLDTTALSTTTMTPPPACMMSDASTSKFWTPSTLINFLVAGIAVVLIGLLSYVALHYRKQANKNRIPDHIINRPPLALPSDIIYDEVYSHCRAFRNRGNQTKNQVLPIHGSTNIKSNQIAMHTYNELVPIRRMNK